MKTLATDKTVALTFRPVKSPLNTQLPLFSDLMIHHKGPRLPDKIIVSYDDIGTDKRYGVSPSHRVLSPQLLFKRWDTIRQCLDGTLGFTPCQGEVTMRLLRLWAYYGNVYPKAAQIAEEPELSERMVSWRTEQELGPPHRSYGCSRATFWRTIALLQRRGLLHVINRYVIRPHAQISNLYRLDQLILVIARYLAEHGVALLEKWLKPYLVMFGSDFWRLAFAAARETDFESFLILPSTVPLASFK